MRRSQESRTNLSATETRRLGKLLLASVFEPQAIGDRLAQARNEAGLTQDEASDLVGLTTRMIQHYEAGEVVPYRHMRKFAGVYKKPIEWLLHGDPEPRDGEITPGQLQQVLEQVEAVHEEVRQMRGLVEELRADLARSSSGKRRAR